MKVGSTDDVKRAAQCGLPVTEAQALHAVWIDVHCGRPMRGRYVFVQGGKGYELATLVLCEVKIFKADSSNEFCSNAALEGIQFKMNQS